LAAEEGGATVEITELKKDLEYRSKIATKKEKWRKKRCQNFPKLLSKILKS